MWYDFQGDNFQNWPNATLIKNYRSPYGLQQRDKKYRIVSYKKPQSHLAIL